MRLCYTEDTPFFPNTPISPCTSAGTATDGFAFSPYKSIARAPQDVLPFHTSTASPTFQQRTCLWSEKPLPRQTRKEKKKNQQGFALPAFPGFQTAPWQSRKRRYRSRKDTGDTLPPPPHAPTPASPVEFPNPRPVANPRGCVTLRAPHRPSAPHGAVRRRRSRPTDPPSLTPQPPTRGVGGEELRRGNPPTRPQTSSSPRTNDTGRLPPSAPRLARTWPGAWRTILSPRPVPAPQSGREEGGDGNASPVRRATVGPPRGC